jgi:hypothetical protein
VIQKHRHEGKSPDESAGDNVKDKCGQSLIGRGVFGRALRFWGHREREERRRQSNREFYFFLLFFLANDPINEIQILLELSRFFVSLKDNLLLCQTHFHTPTHNFLQDGGVSGTV